MVGETGLPRSRRALVLIDFINPLGKHAVALTYMRDILKCDTCPSGPRAGFVRSARAHALPKVLAFGPT